MNRLGLNDETLTAIQNIFKKYPSINRADVFGSRAKGAHRAYSDVDIALYGDLDALTVEEIACALDESPFVYKFDVLSYNQITSPALRQHIDRVGVRVY
jgi:predicted nucleotidyltransferase